MEELTIRDAIGGREGVIKFNYTKLKEKIRKCKEEKDSQACRRSLEEIGVTWVD